MTKQGALNRMAAMSAANLSKLKVANKRALATNLGVNATQKAPELGKALAKLRTEHKKGSKKPVSPAPAPAPAAASPAPAPRGAIRTANGNGTYRRPVKSPRRVGGSPIKGPLVGSLADIMAAQGIAAAAARNRAANLKQRSAAAQAAARNRAVVVMKRVAQRNAMSKRKQFTQVPGGRVGVTSPINSITEKNKSVESEEMAKELARVELDSRLRAWPN
jgi:hypothetical protein